MSGPVSTIDEVATGASVATEAAGSIDDFAPTGGEEITSMTEIHSIAELKTKAPKLYNAMMMGIGMTIISEMQDQQERLKEIRKENERYS